MGTHSSRHVWPRPWPTLCYPLFKVLFGPDLGHVFVWHLGHLYSFVWPRPWPEYTNLCVPGDLGPTSACSCATPTSNAKTSKGQQVKQGTERFKEHLVLTGTSPVIELCNPPSHFADSAPDVASSRAFTPSQSSECKSNIC